MIALAESHVVHVTTAHAADDVRIFHREARLLARHCGRVTIVAANCGGSRDEVQFVSWGEKRPRTRKERLNAATVAARVAGMVGGHLYHFHDPELLLPMRTLAERLRVPVIYDVHEHYRGTLRGNSASRLSGLAQSAAYALIERFAMRSLAGIVTVTPQIAEIYRGWAKRIALVRNLPDIDEILALTQERQPDIDACRMVYSGSLEQRALYPLAGAVRLLEKTHPQISVDLVGDFKDGSEKERILRHWGDIGVADRLQLVGRMPREAFLRSLSRYSVGLVLFWPTPNAQVGLPNKLFEYMACGLPVVVPDLPNQREVVEQTGCGTWCDTTDSRSIAAAISNILDDRDAGLAMGRKGREACETTYRADGDLPSLLQLYASSLKEWA